MLGLPATICHAELERFLEHMALVIQTQELAGAKGQNFSPRAGYHWYTLGCLTQLSQSHLPVLSP